MNQLFGSIRAVLGDLAPNEEVSAAVVIAAWNQCAGELIRERTCPVLFAGERLVVAVSDKTWQRHLEDLSPQMLATLNRSLGQGTVRFIEFRIDAAVIEKSHAAATTRLQKDRAVRVAPSLRKAASAIADDHLRESFLAAASDYLARGRR